MQYMWIVYLIFLVLGLWFSLKTGQFNPDHSFLVFDEKDKDKMSEENYEKMLKYYEENKRE